jgi:hypothetical protein
MSPRRSTRPSSSPSNWLCRSSDHSTERNGIRPRPLPAFSYPYGCALVRAHGSRPSDACSRHHHSKYVRLARSLTFTFCPSLLHIAFAHFAREQHTMLILKKFSLTIDQYIADSMLCFQVCLRFHHKFSVLLFLFICTAKQTHAHTASYHVPHSSYLRTSKQSISPADRVPHRKSSTTAARLSHVSTRLSCIYSHAYISYSFIGFASKVDSSFDGVRPRIDTFRKFLVWSRYEVNVPARKSFFLSLLSHFF